MARRRACVAAVWVTASLLVFTAARYTGGALLLRRATAAPQRLKDALLLRRTAAAPRRLKDDLVAALRVANNTARQKLCGGQRAAYARLRRKLAADEPVKFVTLGGSMTAGMGTSCGRPCSYSAQLCAQFGGRNVSCVNHARGGTTTGSILPLLRGLVEGFEASAKQPADLVIIDFSVNDAHEAQDWLVFTGATAHPGQGWTDYTRAAQDATAAHRATVFAATEALLRALLHFFPDTALVVVEGYYGKDGLESAAAHEQAAVLYGVPFVSFGSSLATPDDPEVWGPSLGLHPPDAVHGLLALALKLWLLETLEQAPRADEPAACVREGPAASAALAARFRVCDAPASLFDAGSAFDSADAPRPTARIGDWALVEDRADKPGWISTAAGSTLEFTVRFGAAPRLVVVYTKGYEGPGEHWGDVELSLPPVKDTVVIKGCCNREKVTQAELYYAKVDTAVHQRDQDGVQGFAVQPNSTRLLRLRLASAGSKFKLLVVTTC
jgi:lysophospholipase L1-like esterase